MRIGFGCEMGYDLAYPTPLIARLTSHPDCRGTLAIPDTLLTDPAVPAESFLDSFGNRCVRLVAPAGLLTLRVEAEMEDDGAPDPVAADAVQHRVEDLPPETLPFLVASRYCESDILSDEAWRLFGDTPKGWARVQAVCDYVHAHIAFGYDYSRVDRTATDALAVGRGVCRDYAHLSVAFLRALNIPTRYCTGYLSFIGEAEPHPREISRPGSKSISEAPGTPSIHATTRPAAAASSSPAVATRRTCRLRIPLGRTG